MKKAIFFLLIMLSFSFVIGNVALASATSTKVPNRQIPHYLSENSLRYEEFQQRNPEMSFDVVVALVNANVDLGFYNEIQEVSNPHCILVLVNKNFALPRDIVYDDLVTADEGRQIREVVAIHFGMMRNSANAAGHAIYVSSGFRNFANQAASYNRWVERSGVEVADRRSARPGHSEHQTGLAYDFVYRRDLIGGHQDGSFAYTGIYSWLRENAHRYGFILRYPRGLEHIHGYIYEPWHWRFIGVADATRMFNESIETFEEYYGRYLNSRVQENLEFFATRFGNPAPAHYRFLISISEDESLPSETFHSNRLSWPVP